MIELRCRTPCSVRQRTVFCSFGRQGDLIDLAGVKHGNRVSTNKRAPDSNLLLAALPGQRLTADLTPVHLAFAQPLYEAGQRIRHVYFPIDSFVSLIAPGEGRAQLEIGLV